MLTVFVMLLLGGFALRIFELRSALSPQMSTNKYGYAQVPNQKSTNQKRP